MKASEIDTNIDVVSTGMPKLDVLTGLGGIPRGYITEISGPWSVGKSTLACQIVSNAQKLDLRCVWADVEYSWQSRYARALGVNLEALEVIRERISEDALDTLEKMMEDEEVDVVVLDSIGGLLPRAEAEKGADGKVIGGQSKIVAAFCRRVVPLLAEKNIALVVLNHEFVDIMHGILKTSGGAKLEYHKALWIKLMKAGKKIMQGERQIGEVVKVQIRKNKLADTVKQEAEMHLMYGKGFSMERDLLEEALKSGHLVKKGNSYFRGSEKIAVGATKAAEWLKMYA